MAEMALMAFTVISTGVQAISAIQKGKAEAAVATQQAESVRLQGEADAIDKRKQLLETVASVNAQAAASGIALTGQGSIENARQQARAEATRQLSLVRHNTAIGVADKRIEAAQAKTAGRARAVGLLASAGERVAARGLPTSGS